MTRLERKKLFIRSLAEFLVGNQAGKSIALEIEAKTCPIITWAQEWAKLRGTTTLFGYPSVDEAEKQLKEFLG